MQFDDKTFFDECRLPAFSIIAIWIRKRTHTKEPFSNRTNSILDVKTERTVENVWKSTDIFECRGS